MQIRSGLIEQISLFVFVHSPPVEKFIFRKAHV